LSSGAVFLPGSNDFGICSPVFGQLVRPAEAYHASLFERVSTGQCPAALDRGVKPDIGR
jgi:hypothetical protein